MTSPDSPAIDPKTPAPAAMPAPTYAQVNGWALAFVGVALPLGALALFAFGASPAVTLGAGIAWGLALVDAGATGWFLRRSAARMEGPPAVARRSGEGAVLAGSFVARLLVLALAILAFQWRLPGVVHPLAFVAVFMALHFAAIGGWGIYLQRRGQQRAEARAAAKG